MVHVGRQAGRRTDADRVLAGQVVASARELISLIHEVNPTGREIDKAEAARRYALKTRLQSLLVQRFADELEVVRDGGEGVVLLRHRYLGVAASHAVVAHLGEEARAWVELQLDLGVVEQAWTRTPGELERNRDQGGQRRRRRARARTGEAARGDAAGELSAAMDEGRAALASYDYEGARAAFERAHGLAPEGAAPLAALLDLLVNRLGLDREALDAAEGAAGAIGHSPAVRATLGLAAARLGERERAEAWGRQLDGAPAAAVFRTLAAGAIGAGDLDYAARALTRARQCLPGDPERLAVEAELGRARAAAVVEDEGRLARLVAAGDGTAAELARRIVERHPGSAVARAVLKDVAARDRRARQQALLDEARAAMPRGRFKVARQALAAARELGASAETLANAERDLGAAAARAAEVARELRLGEIAAQLEGPAGERRAGLVAYLGLDERDRGAVRRRCDGHRADFVWLDQVPATPAGRAGAIAAAVVGARAAARLLDEGDGNGAERAVLPHRVVLEEHGFGRELLARMAEHREAREQTRARLALEQAGAALRARDVSGARTLLEGIARDRLPAPTQPEFDRLSRDLAAARRTQALLALADHHLAKQHSIHARRVLLERLAESDDADERGVLRERLVQVDAEVRQAYLACDVVPPPGYLASEAPETAINYAIDRGVEVGLLKDGKTALLLSVGHGILAARLVDVDSGQLVRLLAWRLPEAVMSRSLGVTDERLWIANTVFFYVEIDCESWLPCRQAVLKPDGGSVEVLAKCTAMPGSNVAWLTTRRLGAGAPLRVQAIDIARGAPLDLRDDDGDVYHIPGEGRRPVARFWPGESPMLESARADSHLYLDLDSSREPLAIAVAPDGHGHVILSDTKSGAEPRLELSLVDEDGFERTRLALPVAHEGRASVATVRSRRLLCVTYRARGSGESRLLYVRQPGEAELVPDADVALPGLIGIEQDSGASTAAAVCTSADGVRLTRLDDMPTAFLAADDAVVVPKTFGFLPCSPPPATPEVAPSDEIRYLSESDPELTDARLAALAKGIAHSWRAHTVYRLLRKRGIHGRADRLLEYMEQQETKSLLVRIAVTEREALAGRWVGDALEAEMGDAGREHMLHLRAVACLRAGQVDQAVVCLSGRAEAGPCHLDHLLAMARALAVEQAGGAVAAAALNAPGVAGLVHACFAADRALARGEPDEALRLLDRAWIRRIGEAQTMARLASLYVAITEPSPLQVFKATTLLSDFIECRFPITPDRQVWLGASTWPKERLESLERQAGKRLGEIAGHSAGPRSDGQHRERQGGSSTGSQDL